MYITLEADYAVRICIFLAKEKRRVDANTIAENTGVTLRFALKILRNLVKANIAKSYKGTQGGYELEADPKKLTLNDILEVIEGKYAISRCLLSDECCSNPNSSDCKVHKAFAKISNEVRRMLTAVSLYDVL